jgi:hypothetical protein
MSELCRRSFCRLRLGLGALLACILKGSRGVILRNNHDPTSLFFDLSYIPICHVAFPTQPSGEVAGDILPVRTTYENLSGCAGVLEDHAGLISR